MGGAAHGQDDPVAVTDWMVSIAPTQHYIQPQITPGRAYDGVIYGAPVEHAVGSNCFDGAGVPCYSSAPDMREDYLDLRINGEPSLLRLSADTLSVTLSNVWSCRAAGDKLVCTRPKP